MKSPKLHLLAAVCMLASLCLPAWAQVPVLPYEQPTPGTISSAAQSNAYTLPVNANDVLNFTVVATSSISGAFGPCISLYDPNNNLVDTAGGNYSTDVEMNGYQALLTGNYTVLIQDCANVATGDYEIFVEKTNNPSPVVALPYAQPTTGQITSTTQSNAYNFTANKNDVVSFTVVATSSTSGSFGPCILLYDSSGTPVLDSAGGNYSTDVEMNDYQILKTGTYNVFIRDCADVATGNYVVFLQKTNDPIDSFPIVYDQVQTGSIGSTAQSNAYTLIGTAGDVLNFTVDGTTSPTSVATFGPCILLYNATGTQPLDSAGGNYSQDVTMDGYRVPATGTYNVFIKDCADVATGTYTLQAECLGTCALPAPTLTSISPTNVLAGSGPFTLTANGTGFASVLEKSQVEWNTSGLTTTFVSTNQLTAAVPGTDTATAGTFPITVFTPPGGSSGGTSTPPLYFTVNNPVPTTTAPLSPASCVVGTGPFTLTVNGSSFVTSSSVQWNGTALATTYVSATQLTATVPASDCTTAGTATVTVFNATPGGGTSNGQTFTCDNPAPTATSLSPTSAEVSGAAFTLTVYGTNFVPTSTVNWNSSGRATTYVSGTELQAAILATDLTAQGTALVTVTNPTPGGGTSSPGLPLPIEPAKAVLTSPAGGTVLTGPTVTFTWTAAYGATGYNFRLGTTPGGNNLLASGEITATSITATGLPTNGEPIYATLYTDQGPLGTSTPYNTYTFTASTQASLLSPANDTVLTGPTVTFTWTAATGAPTGYNFRLGTTPGANNLLASGEIAATSVTATGLPTNGETIYATLYTDYGSVQVSKSYMFTASTQAALTSPANGSVLPGPTVTFTWTAATGATGYNFRLGTTPGENNLLASGEITATSITATGLPTNGEPIYATLYTDYGSIQVSKSYTFTASTQAALTSPTPGSVLPGPTVTFTWTAATGATGYNFRLGTTPGTNNLFFSGEITATSVTVTGLPTNGEPIYATLYTDYGSIQVSKSYTFTASTQASLTSPTPGSVLTGPTVTFTWKGATGAGVTGYNFRLGTTPGTNNLFFSGEITATSITATGLPTNGETIYATLITDYGTVQVSTPYTFTASTQAAVTSPTPGSVLTGPTVTFTWTAAIGATGYNFRLGTTPGTNNLLASGEITATSITATGLPTNGETIYATLITDYGSVQVSTPYTFTAYTAP